MPILSVNGDQGSNKNITEKAEKHVLNENTRRTKKAFTSLDYKVVYTFEGTVDAQTGPRMIHGYRSLE